MTHTFNRFGQPIGLPVLNWTPPSLPPRTPLKGRLCRLEPMDATRHAVELHAANTADDDDRSWTYLPLGPFETLQSYRDWMNSASKDSDPLFFVIVESASGSAVGMAAYLRIMPSSGSIEVGAIHYSPRMVRTAMATEAMFLMMQLAFDLGYRRYEWKCDALNAPSRAAAQRLGFSYEGMFRQATVYKSRTRDTAWYSVIDTEWPKLRDVFASWLDPANFDELGRQRSRLSDLTRPLLTQRG